jgi:cysteine synthase B
VGADRRARHPLRVGHGHHRHHHRRGALSEGEEPGLRVIGAQPAEGARIPGIRKWPEAYLPRIYDPAGVDELVPVLQDDAEDMARRMAREEGIFGGISSGGAAWVAQQIAAREADATIVFVVCDRGDRYLSTGVFPA